MNLQRTSAPVDAAPYRQACDRCHRQKLRCIRESDYSGGACIRCFKAQVRCVTSPSLRRRGESLNGSTKGTTRKVTPEPVPEECLPSSVLLDEGTLPDPNFMVHDACNQGSTGQSGPDIDLSLLNFSWPPNVSSGEVTPGGMVTPGMTGLPRGQDGAGFSFCNDLGQNDMMMDISNQQALPVANIRPSPPTTLPLTGETSLSPSHFTQAHRNEAWIHSLTKINVDLYLQHSVLEQNLRDDQRDMECNGADLARKDAISPESSNQFCIGHTFDLMHRFLQLLDEVSSNNTRARLDRGSVLLVLSCYHRLLEIYGIFFQTPDLGHASAPELSRHMKHSPFLMGQFELYTNSPLYTPLVVSLADFMLLKCRDAVNKINGLSDQKEPIGELPMIMGAASAGPAQDSFSVTADPQTRAQGASVRRSA